MKKSHSIGVTIIVYEKMIGLFKISIRCVQQMAKIKRPPVVTIMGHVDHGKTTLLDNLRNSNIVKQEFGGITQHIGAFVVPFKKDLVTFLDTPGHAAFAAMRQRGANVTDIVVLVVACEDGVLDQTIESINYAKKSRVPIIVAVNKVDKFNDIKKLNQNIDLLKKQLFVHDIVTEEDGGDVQMVKISALKGIGIEDLKEAILALAETLNLEADIDCPVKGHVIESQIHLHRGKLCTALITAGVLKKGDIILATNSHLNITYNYAKVRALVDERGQLNVSCQPGLPIQITGWREEQLPAPGDSIIQVDSETEAKSLVHHYRQSNIISKAKEDSNAAERRAQEHQRLYQEMLKTKQESGHRYGRTLYVRGQRPRKVEEDSAKKINVVLKCDVDGSLEALLDLLDTYDKDGRQSVKLDVMHYGVGPINENDYRLASSFTNSVIYGFNVRPLDQKLMTRAKHDGIDLKLFNVIYHLIDDLKKRIVDMTPEREQEVEVGAANVIQEFIVKEGKVKTHVAGCRCNWGTLKKDLFYKLIRNSETLHKDLRIKTLKHLKDDVQEIEKDRECGISFIDPESSIEFLPGDKLVAYEKRKYKPKLKWELRGF